MYNDYYYTPEITSSTSVDTTWLVISVVLALVGGIAAYFLFVRPKNDGKFTGFLAWLYDFLNFKKYFLEVIIKILYMVCAIGITLGSFSLIGTSVASFFLVLILGNVVARITFEFCLMLLTIVNNTTEINKKLSTPQKNETSKSNKKTSVEKE